MNYGLPNETVSQVDAMKKALRTHLQPNVIFAHILKLCAVVFRTGHQVEHRSTRDLAAQKFVYNWALLNDLGIPLTEWSDLLEEGLQLLRQFVENEHLSSPSELPGYGGFFDRYQKRALALMKDARYQHLFEEILHH